DIERRQPLEGLRAHSVATESATITESPLRGLDLIRARVKPTIFDRGQIPEDSRGAAADVEHARPGPRANVPPCQFPAVFVGPYQILIRIEDERGGKQ